MKNLTTPKAIFFGFLLIALSITTLPYSQLFLSKAYAGFSGKNADMFQDQLSSIADAIQGISACRN
tara:strand:- start:33 stop:230 length:198 start_codon:yes stop_codon:yes gene_type:complete